jgi:murein DD-endopeptidase MepM/ murein hydrolase activator NlpD
MASYRPPLAGGDVTGSITPSHVLPPPPPAAQPVRAAAPAPQPVRAAPAPQRQASNTTVTIGHGDTIAVLSRRYGVSMGEIIRANRLASPNDLKIGQQITIPRHGGTPVAAAVPQAPAATQPRTLAAPATVPAAKSYGGFHVAGPGDTLNKIARRYQVSVTDLARANRLSPNTQIRLGDRLAIPARVSSQAPAAQSAPVPQPAPQQVAASQPAPQKTIPVQKVAAASPQKVAAPVQKVAAATPPEPQHTANVARSSEPVEEDNKREASGAMFRWPVRGRIVTAFGAKPNGQQNDGINIAVPEGTPVKAAEEGDVAYAGNELKGYGNLILIRHPNGFVTAYAHASELLVKRGDKVKRGQIIAKSGRTGNISAPQLHFEIRKGSTPVDPTPYLGA